MRTIDKIIIHCSDSSFGDAAVIDGWHKERGWDGIGYNFVILNGSRNPGVHVPGDDGIIELGRSLGTPGAHCYGHNKTSIGICMIGTYDFTPRQHVSLIGQIVSLMESYHLTPDDIYGHRELGKGKTCPNKDIEELRRYLRWIRKSEEQ